MKKNIIIVSILCFLLFKVFSVVPEPFPGKGTAVIQFYLDITEDIDMFKKGTYTKEVMISIKNVSTGQSRLVYPNSKGLIILYNFDPGKYELTGFEIRKLSNSDNYYYKQDFDRKIKFPIKKDGIIFAGSIVVTMIKAPGKRSLYVDYYINQTKEKYKSLREKFAEEDKDGLYKKLKIYKIVKEDKALEGIPEGSIIYEYEKGYFVFVGDNRWEQRIKFKKDTFYYEQYKQDDKNYYIKDEKRGLFISIPVEDEGYLKVLDNNKWKNALLLKKINKPEKDK